MRQRHFKTSCKNMERARIFSQSKPAPLNESYLIYARANAAVYYCRFQKPIQPSCSHPTSSHLRYIPFPPFLYHISHQPNPPKLHPKQLLQLPHRILRALNTMPHGPLILKNLIIVAAFVRLVAEEVNRRVLDAADFFFFGEVLQAVGFVPAGGEDVEGDLAADGVAMGEGLVWSG